MFLTNLFRCPDYVDFKGRKYYLKDGDIQCILEALTRDVHEYAHTYEHRALRCVADDDIRYCQSVALLFRSFADVLSTLADHSEAPAELTDSQVDTCGNFLHYTDNLQKLSTIPRKIRKWAASIRGLFMFFYMLKYGNLIRFERSTS